MSLIEKSREKSPWIYHLNTGSCNGCDIELLALLGPRYDVERFGVKFVGSPRHADIIVVTGDLIDSNNTNIDIAMELISGAIKIAPIYYVSGNHEAWSGSYDELKSNLENSGVVVLDNQKIEVMNDSDSIDIIGLADTSFIESDWLEYGGNAETKNLLNTLTEGTTNFKILLSHRPELFDIYSNSNVNLIFSGHAHGGQFRLPFIGGLIAPDQGFFPKLTEGIHTSNDTSMIISRGLGNSIIPVRILNRPELIVVTLSK